MNARWLDAELEDADRAPQRRGTSKKKKLLGRRRLDDLTAEDPDRIADDTIRRLIDLGHITEIVAELKSGKEATAYVARGPRGSVLVKLYRELEARSFKNDAVYREGQVILDERAARAMGARSRKGLEMLQAGWVSAEYAHLWTLWRAGLNVPEPLVGPFPFDYDATTPAVLMRLIGTEDHVAPRLSEARLTPEEAQSAWQQAVQGLADLLRLGYAHGDYSTYNLLWWENKVIMIDFPQLTTRQNPHFQELLRRDAHSLATSFRKHGVQVDGEATLREAQRLARGKGPEPRIVLP
ncbi:RIO1 family regulatory kinase/ATPase [Deinococcus humi]|uniref:non-specific serine/threonine protein kinase n=1 Tax=Deinococcus humi TaxID=662880 RepID=A0A7W8NED1_9DEIO|nr:RIO1 family regulatory kinase/ATPase [Deinococcus humi]MBB5363226.1 RIO kinase 1 [Deinococcus humi]GGO27577.1 serine/threonine protein kinase [Deinococcus humi]